MRFQTWYPVGDTKPAGWPNPPRQKEVPARPDRAPVLVADGDFVAWSAG
jgi:hypothetical protein